MTFRHAISFLDGLFLESSKQQQNFIATIKGKFHKWAKEEIEIESRQKEKKKSILSSLKKGSADEDSIMMTYIFFNKILQYQF